MESVSSDEVYQDQILPHVSRTFALTIPQLPAGLRIPVTNAYLLCRIADTIEDEPALLPPQTLDYLQRFSAVTSGNGDPIALARELERCLSNQTLATERDLVKNMDKVIRVTLSLAPAQRAALQRCVDIMCFGMPRFQFNASVSGLARSTDLDDYCYYVAGVVGEMLTDLFCDHSSQIAQQKPMLSALSTSFAQGLQMTNILKDVWEDRSRGACWLPQEVFSRFGVDLAKVEMGERDPKFAAGMSELVGVAHAHLRNALDYTLLIPSQEIGIRRFCLWAIGLAILTLRKIARHPGFTAGAEVKVKRSTVRMTLLLTNLAVRNDWLLRRLFGIAAWGVPMAPPPELKFARTTPLRAECAAAMTREPPLRRSYGNSGT